MRFLLNPKAATIALVAFIGLYLVADLSFAGHGAPLGVDPARAGIIFGSSSSSADYFDTSSAISAYFSSMLAQSSSSVFSVNSSYSAAYDCTNLFNSYYASNESASSFSSVDSTMSDLLVSCCQNLPKPPEVATNQWELEMILCGYSINTSSSEISIGNGQ